MKTFKQILNEVPHIHYNDVEVKSLSNNYIDFHFENMNISNIEKRKLMNSFFDKGVIAKYKKNYILFTPKRAEFIKNNLNLPILPEDWAKYIEIIN